MYRRESPLFFFFSLLNFREFCWLVVPSFFFFRFLFCFFLFFFPACALTEPRDGRPMNQHQLSKVREREWGEKRAQTHTHTHVDSARQTERDRRAVNTHCVASRIYFICIYIYIFFLPGNIRIVVLIACKIVFFFLLVLVRSCVPVAEFLVCENILRLPTFSRSSHRSRWTHQCNYIVCNSLIVCVFCSGRLQSISCRKLRRASKRGRKKKKEVKQKQKRGKKAFGLWFRSQKRLGHAIDMCVFRFSFCAVYFACVLVQVLVVLLKWMAFLASSFCVRQWKKAGRKEKKNRCPSIFSFLAKSPVYPTSSATHPNSAHTRWWMARRMDKSSSS